MVVALDVSCNCVAHPGSDHGAFHACDTSDVEETVLPTLAWARAKVHSTVGEDGDSAQPQGGSGFACPVLARGWGKRLQLLQVQPVGGYLTAHPVRCV